MRGNSLICVQRFFVKLNALAVTCVTEGTVISAVLIATVTELPSCGTMRSRHVVEASRGAPPPTRPANLMRDLCDRGPL